MGETAAGMTFGRAVLTSIFNSSPLLHKGLIAIEDLFFFAPFCCFLWENTRDLVSCRLKSGSLCVCSLNVSHWHRFMGFAVCVCSPCVLQKAFVICCWWYANLLGMTKLAVNLPASKCESFSLDDGWAYNRATACFCHYLHLTASNSKVLLVRLSELNRGANSSGDIVFTVCSFHEVALITTEKCTSGLLMSI